jgi:hypothetical protein
VNLKWNYRDPRSSKAKFWRLLTSPLAVALVTTLISAPPCASGQAVACIPPPTNRTPGLPGPPDWIGTFNAPVKTGLDDPRWDGAGGFTWANGTSGDTAQFQAISSGGNVFLSWLVKLPPQGSGPENVVYLGFTQAAGTPANFAITINLKNTTGVTDGDSASYNASAYSVSGTGVPTAITLPPWINTNTRVWITNSNFAVQMVVPISAAGINSGVNLGTDFKMWFEMQEALPPANPATVWDAVFPDGRGGTPTATDVVAFLQFPAPSSWASFHQSSGPGDLACTLGGISIDADHIGTTNSPISKVLFQASGSPNPPPVNTFFASPKNGMITAIPAGGITATFRIADWGSTYDPNAPWKTIPGGQDVPSTSAINPGDTAAQNNINFNWTVQNISGGEQWLSNFQGGKERDQCMLVELAGGALSTWQASHVYTVNATIVDPKGNLQRVTTAGTSGGVQPLFNAVAGGSTSDSGVTWTNSGPAIGPGLTFLNNSVLRNMDFVPASEFDRNATIDIQGLVPLGADPRDVYLYVVSRNMPSIVDAVWKNLFNQVFGAPNDRNDQKTHAILNRMPVEQREETVPSYRVYVFHDSGKKVTVNSKDYLIVHPQSGFGYYMLPHADVAGWVNTMQGANQIAANFYRIAVPNNGKAKISTKIVALEQLPKECFGHSGPGGIFLLVPGVFLLGILVYLPRKNEKRKN